jgi:hypothetical protein
MSHSDLMGVSLPALTLLLVASYAIAESALGDALFGGRSRLARAAVPARRCAPRPSQEGAERRVAGRRREAARRKRRGLSRCFSRARLRRVMRFRGRR